MDPVDVPNNSTNHYDEDFDLHAEEDFILDESLWYIIINNLTLYLFIIKSFFLVEFLV
jgi:hypothetical protein